ncbi:alpha beta-hydrolase [Mycena vitilis]|nr:alpha beta-hydrolase [Mycena vitilis]
MPKLTLPSGHTWAYVDANPHGATTLLCLHGFPDLAYGYRHQIGPWARAGFRVVVPDMLGYGGSDAPVDPAQYTTKRLSADLAALLTVLGVDRAVVVGHDWGSFTAGRFALWHPERVIALVLMSVPYTPPAIKPTSLADVAARAPNLGYQLFLASPVAAPTIEANIPYFLALLFSPPSNATDITPASALPTLLASSSSPSASAIAALPTILPAPALRAYAAAFRARGMTGPTNYYRTTRLRYLEEAAAASSSSASYSPSATSSSPGLEGASSPGLSLPSTLPVLSLYGTLDSTIPPAALKTQRRFVGNGRLTEVPLRGVGHWVLVQDADAAAPSSSPSMVVDGEGGRPGLGKDGNSNGDSADPLESWRERVSKGAWKQGNGDGGAVGRAVLKWLDGLGINGGEVRGEVRGKL